jgi:hypothetical protein
MEITKHAYQRAKERCGLNKKAIDHLLPIALEKGLSHKETIGSLNKWVSGVYLRYGNGSNMRVYGEYLFICDHKALITIYKVPNNLKMQARILLKKKHGEEI